MLFLRTEQRSLFMETWMRKKINLSEITSPKSKVVLKQTNPIQFIIAVVDKFDKNRKLLPDIEMGYLTNLFEVV